MGQHCVKSVQSTLGSGRDVIAPSAYQDHSKSKESYISMRYQVNHSDIQEILDRLNPDHYLHFLAIFREICKNPLNQLLEWTTRGEKENQTATWRRPSCNEASFLSCLNAANYTTTVQYLQQFASGYNCIISSVLRREIVDLHRKVNLFQAFQYGNILYGDESNGVSNEILFQDLCVGLAICLRGTPEEMLTFLFLLFAKRSETPAHPHSPAPGDSSEDPFPKQGTPQKQESPENLPTGFSLTLEKPNEETAEDVKTPPIDHFSLDETGFYSLLLFLEIFSLAQYDVFPQYRGPNEAFFFGNIPSPKPSHSITGRWSRIEKLSKFLLTLRTGGVPPEVTNPGNKTITPFTLHCKQFLLLCTLEGDLVNVLNQCHRNMGLNLGLAATERRLGVEGVQLESLVNKKSLKGILSLLIRPVMPDPFQSLSRVCNYLKNSYAISRGLHTELLLSLELFYNTKNHIIVNPRAKESPTRQHEGDLSRAVFQDGRGLFSPPEHFPVFILDAEWFSEWCEGMEVRPVFATGLAESMMIDSLLVDLIPWDATLGSAAVFGSREEHKESSLGFLMKSFESLLLKVESSSKTNKSFKHETHDQLGFSLGSVDKEPGLHFSKPLINSKLIQRNQLGLLFFLPSTELVPLAGIRKAPTGEVVGESGKLRTFVVVPRAIGEILYDEFDVHKQFIPRDTYSRLLCFTTDECSQDNYPQKKSKTPPLSTDKGEKLVITDFEELGSSANQFVQHFNATNRLELDFNPIILPFFWCTSLGAATFSPVDVAVLPSFLKTSTTPYWETEVGRKLTPWSRLQEVVEFSLNRMRLNLGPFEAGAPPLTYKDVRLWGLYRNTSVYDTNSPVLSHSTEFCWLLIAESAEDFQVPLSYNNSSTPVKGAEKRIVQIGSASTLSETETTGCVGFMLETRDKQRRWSADRLLRAQTRPPSSPLRQSDSRLEFKAGGSDGSATLNGQSKVFYPEGSPLYQDRKQMNVGIVGEQGTENSPLQVGERVDVLDEGNRWVRATVLAVDSSAKEVVLQLPVVKRKNPLEVVPEMTWSSIVRWTDGAWVGPAGDVSVSFSVNSTRSAKEVEGSKSGLTDKNSLTAAVNSAVSRTTSPVSAGSLEGPKKTGGLLTLPWNTPRILRDGTMTDLQEESSKRTKDKDKTSDLSLSELAVMKTLFNVCCTELKNLGWLEAEAGSESWDWADSGALAGLGVSSRRLEQEGAADSLTPVEEEEELGGVVEKKGTESPEPKLVKKNFSSAMSPRSVKPISYDGETNVEDQTLSQKEENGVELTAPLHVNGSNGNLTSSPASPRGYTPGTRGPPTATATSSAALSTALSSAIGDIYVPVNVRLLYLLSSAVEAYRQLPSSAVVVSGRDCVAFPLLDQVSVVGGSKRVMIMPRGRERSFQGRPVSSSTTVTASDIHLNESNKLPSTTAAPPNSKKSQTSEGKPVSVKDTSPGETSGSREGSLKSKPLNSTVAKITRLMTGCTTGSGKAVNTVSVAVVSNSTAQPSSDSLPPTFSEGTGSVAVGEDLGTVSKELLVGEEQRKPLKTPKFDLIQSDSESEEEELLTTQHEKNGSVSTTSGGSGHLGPEFSHPGKTPAECDMMVPGIIGLNNMGNTCFMSSALQCLLRAPLFPAFFLTGQFRQHINRNNKLGSKGLLVEEFSFFVNTAFHPQLTPNKPLQAPAAFHPLLMTLTKVNHRGGAFSPHGQTGKRRASLEGKEYLSLSPSRLMKVFQSQKPQFSGADQQDSQEFLSELLDTFHEDLKASATPSAGGPIFRRRPSTIRDSTTDLLGFNKSNSSSLRFKNNNSPERARSKSPSKPTSSTPEKDKKPGERDKNPLKEAAKVLKQGEDCWSQYHELNNSIISDLFQGQTCSHITCKVCNSASVTFEPFTTLSMPIPKSGNKKTEKNTSVVNNEVFKGNMGSKDGFFVVVTVFRKMPRLSLIHKLLKNEKNMGNGNIDLIEQYYRDCCVPFRLTLSMSPRATVAELKTLAINTYNATLQNPVGSAAEPNGESRKPKHSFLEFINVTAMHLAPGLPGQVRKILDNKDVLQACLGDNDETGGSEILLLENNKNISFISSLSAQKLASLANNTKIIQKTESGKIIKSKEYSINQYSDEFEYETGHPLFCGYDEDEGFLLQDVENTFNPDSYPFSKLNSKSGSQKNGKNSVPSSNYGEKRRNWPSGIGGSNGFILGDRVDAIDHKGSWYSGTVVDLLFIPNLVVMSAKNTLTKYNREFTQSKSKSGKVSKNENVAAKKIPVKAGWHLRVHFDGFSFVWDEWYDIKDFELGFLLPVYTKAQRKLKIHDIQVIQRMISKTQNESQLRVELIETPLLVQIESFRSVSHFLAHMKEILMRFIPEENIKDILEKGIHSWKTPYQLRMLSVNNLFAYVGADEQLKDQNRCDIPEFPLSDEANPKQVQAVTEKIISRFHLNKSWEGFFLPTDKNIPIANLAHNRFLIAVDWENDICLEKWKPILYKDDLSFVKFTKELEKMNISSPSEGKGDSPVSIKNGFIDKRPGIALDSVLRKFVGCEELEEYYCEKCFKLNPATLQTSIHKLPDVLVLHFQRLVMNSSGGGKIRTLVKFPIENLDMHKYTTASLMGETLLKDHPDRFTSEEIALTLRKGGSKLLEQYDLFGVVNHLGGMFGGHYTAVAQCEQIPETKNSIFPSKTHPTHTQNTSKPFIDPNISISEFLTSVDGEFGFNCGVSGGNEGFSNERKWFKFDDEYVMELPTEDAGLQIVTDSAYLLFYRRKRMSGNNLAKYY